jgi:uncharacterized repeat protein (TIGR01451 family)
MRSSVSGRSSFGAGRQERGWLRACFRALIVVTLVAFTGPPLDVAMADPVSPLTVTKTANPSPVVSGQQLTYTINVVNTGGAKVDNVVMTDQVNGVGVVQLPPALPQLILTSTKGNCTQGGPNGNVVTCNAGTLAGGESWTVTIRGQVTASNGTVLNNTASVTGTKSAQNFTTNASVAVLVQNGTGGGSLADLTLNKTGPTSVATSAPITYTLTVNNTGTVNAAGVRVVDTVPAGVTGITATGTSLFVCAVLGQTVTCTGGAVNQGQNATITIKGTAPAVAGQITNTAVVDPDNTIAESNELNNTSATVYTEVGGTPAAPLLDIKKTDGSPAPSGSWWNGAGPDPVSPGQKITYKILVTNNATGNNSRADDVVVTDGTQGLDAASIVATQTIVNGTLGNGNGCTVVAPQVRCSIRSLNSGGTLTVTITGTVLSSAGSTIFNTATVTGNVKNTGVSNTASEVTTVRPAVDLTITKADSPDPVCARSWPGPDAPSLCQGGLKYTFVVGNSGMTAATNVVVRDVLPAGVIYDSYLNVDAADFACPAGPLTGNVLVCTNASIAADSIESFSIIVVAPPGVGPITNSATVDPDNAIFEADETNNISAIVTTQVATGIDLIVYKFDKQGETVDPPGMTPAYPPAPAGFDPIATSGTQTYTIYVDNIGTQDATGIRVRDTLPAGTKFLSATTDPAHGFTCTHDGAASAGVVECIGGHILGTESEFYDPPGPAVPAGNDFATITIKIFATANVQPAMHNEVRVDPLGEIAEFNEQNNLAVQDTKVENGDATTGAFNELSIVKTQTDPAANEVATSSTVTYQIVVTNSGTDPAVNVKVRDFLPAGFAFVEATDVTTGPGVDPLDFFCTQSGTVQSGIIVNCSGATLDGTLDAMGAAVPSARTLQIKATSASQPGNYTNQAIVDPDGQMAEGNETNNSSSVVTKVKVGVPQGFIDLTLNKTATPNVTPGSQIIYTLTVNNVGTDPAFNVVLSDNLPAGTTFVSATDITPPLPIGAGAFSCSHAGGVVTCTGATLDGTADLIADPEVAPSRTVEIKVLAPKQNVTIVNQARVDPGNAIAESNETNNSASASTTVSSVINLTLDKRGPNNAKQNSEDDYVITVTNNIIGGGSGEVAFGAHVHDALPIGLIPLSVTADPSNMICQIAENPVNVVDCVGDIEPGATVTITIHVFITANGGPLDNEACVDPENRIVESDETDNCKTKTTVVVPPAPDLSVTKAVDKTVATPGDSLTYTVTVSNVGDANAAGPISVLDTLPLSSVDFVSANASNSFSCPNPPAGNLLTCTGPSLNVGEFTEITIQVKIKDSASAPITNSVTVGTVSGETNTGNNSDSVVTSVGAEGIDLVLVSVSDSPDPTPRGDSVTYQIVVSNGGTSNATGVKVKDVFNSNTGLTVASATGSQGFACDNNLSDFTIECNGNLDAGQSTTIKIVLQTSATSPASLGSTITVDPDSTIAESNELNNSATEVTTISGAICSSCKDLVISGVLESADPITVGGGLTYTVTVGNIGDTTTDTGPGGQLTIYFDFEGDGGATFTPGSYTATAGFTCTPVFTDADTRLTNCTGDLAPGQGTIITFSLTATAAGTITATGEADGPHTIGEFLETNNGPVTQTTTVNPP